MGDAYRYMETYIASTNNLLKIADALEAVRQPFCVPRETILCEVQDYFLQSADKLVQDNDSIALSFTYEGKEIPEDVLAFCQRESLLEYTRFAMELVKEHFRAHSVDVCLQNDLDTDDQWIILNVQVRDSVEDILRQYDSYIDDWVAAVPWPAVDQIRLSYDIE